MNSLLLDGVVIVAYFIIIIGIGLSQRSRSGSLEGFALGDRQIAWWAVLASILAAEISAGTFFGTPGEGFALKNFTYAQLIIGYILARVVVSFFFTPAFYRHNVVSIYEFLEIRFGPKTRRVASAVFLVTRVLASGTRLWVPTIMVVLAWKMGHSNVSPTEEFWLYAAALVLITLLTAVYTAVGGIRAVIWTDVIQVVILFCALGFSVYFLLSSIPGGWEGAKEHLTGKQDLDFLALGDWPSGAGWGDGWAWWSWLKNVLESEYTIWAALFASTFTTMATHGTDQDMVQRMLTAKNKRQSAVATILSGLVDLPVAFAVLLIGILLSVFYQTHPAALLPLDIKGKVVNSQVFPQFILTQMPIGLRGLVIAGVLATAMGSLGTALNSLATSYVRDFHFRWFGEPEDEAGKVRVLRFGTAIFAVLLISVGLATAYVVTQHPEMRIIPIILGIFGYTYGSLLGIFLVGLFTKTRGSNGGNVLAMAAGFVSVAYLSGLDKSLAGLWGGSGLPRVDGMVEIEFPWRIMFGTLVTTAVALCFRTRRN